MKVEILNFIAKRVMITKNENLIAVLESVYVRIDFLMTTTIMNNAKLAIIHGFYLIILLCKIKTKQ